MPENQLEGISPVTQSIESGNALAKFLGMQEELPETIILVGSARLTLSSKRDCYYYTTPQSCTCKAGSFGRSCRHRKELEGCTKPRGQSLAETLEQHDRDLWKMPKSYQRIVRMAREEAEAEPLSLINKRGFKPVLPGE